MLKYCIFIIICTFSFLAVSQSIIVSEQNFDHSTSEWNFTSNVPFFNNGIDGFYGIHDGDGDNDINDTGEAAKSSLILYQSITNDFLFINDLSDEGNNGTNGEAVISFDNIDISTYHSVFISLDYEIIEFDSADYIKYEIIEDGISSEIITLPKNDFGTLNISLKNKTQSFILKIIIKQNGVDDFAAIDNIELHGTSIDPCDELMISEYIEGTSSINHRNNFIELYNPTDTAIDLENYNLVKYTGASLTFSGILNISGSIPAYGSFLIEDDKEILGIDSDLSTGSSAMDFTGDDKIALRNADSIIDLIGILGEEADFAKDLTLRRKSNIQNPNNQYNKEEWDIYGLEDTVNLNSHISSCSGIIPEIEVYGNSIGIIDGAISSTNTNNTNFGDIDPFSENIISKTFTIKNSGSDILKITKLEIIGTHSMEFTLQNETFYDINPNDSINFQIDFSPISLGIKTAIVNIINNDASENPFNFTIQGEGSGLSNSPLMITQYYEGSANNKWLEIKNTTDFIIPENTYYLALYWNDDAKNPIGIKPSRNKIIPSLLPGETLRYNSTLTVTQPVYAINGDEVKTTVCSFTGDDIIIISTTNDESCWANKVDIIGNSSNWGANVSFVRKYGCIQANPKTGFDINDWLIFEIDEVNSAISGLNIRIGEHFMGPTTFERNNEWSNGLPDMYRNAIINDNFDSTIHGNFEICNLTISENRTLQINPGNFVSIINDLTVNGILEIAHEGSLQMINNFGIVINNGITNIHKTTTTLKKYDYTYWSSPVANAILENVFAASPQNSFYQFDTQNYNDLDNDGYDDDNNAWQKASDRMEIGKAYTAMAPDTDPFIDKQSIVFSGKVNNGILNVPVYLSLDNTNEFDDWNFIGNPYPSAINAELLLNNSNNKNLLNSTIYLWTHNTSAQSDDNGEKYSSDDYAMYTIGTGGIVAISDGAEPTGYIASGQGFFVEAINEGNIEFNNSMRTKLDNNNFFKQDRIKDRKVVKDKIWLNLYTDNGAFSQILIGFMKDASSSYESKYDGLRFKGNNFLSFYSLVDNQRLAIQGTSAFTGNESFSLGFSTTIEEEVTLKIDIDHLEGVFQKQDIYLFDKKLNKTHNIKLSEYEFISNADGSFDNRFILKFHKSDLDFEDDPQKKEKLILKKEGNFLQVKTSFNNIISSLTIYDLLGRKIKQLNANNSIVLVPRSNLKDGNIFVIHATLSDSKVMIKKFLHFDP